MQYKFHSHTHTHTQISVSSTHVYCAVLCCAPSFVTYFRLIEWRLDQQRQNLTLLRKRSKQTYSKIACPLYYSQNIDIA